MPNCSNALWNSIFSHVYVEEAARNHPLAVQILSRLRPNTVQIPIGHYKDVFCRSGQNFSAQKKSPQLILAVKGEHFFYKGSDMCDNYGYENFYYASHVMNCLFDCEYCYLQGMYPSAHVVVFVNMEDYLAAAEKLPAAYLCVSYDTDLLAFENMTGFTARWAEFAADHPETTIEIRTKSGAFDALSRITPRKNIILAWTLSPEPVITNYEHGTADLHTRLQCMRAAFGLGWRVRLCVDPVLYIQDWETHYAALMATAARYFEPGELEGVSVGAFRVSRDYFKKMMKLRQSSALLAYPFENRHGVMCYPRQLEEKLTGCMDDF